ncbi:peptidoglycan-binding domain-containing protein [Streptomyces parvulus]|uniref:peptidoglycan-binding domain-containing protein n=1 Tax=Streptomyces parvulus TaxID=146923 RepID=UPI0037F2A65E
MREAERKLRLWGESCRRSHRLTVQLLKALSAAGGRLGQPAELGTSMNRRYHIDDEACFSELDAAASSPGTSAYFLTRSGFEPWEHNGLLGTDSWKAAQRLFNAQGFHGGTRLVVDGVVGPRTIKALQRFLNSYGFRLAVDGIVGDLTTAAFWEFNGVPVQDRRCV